MKTVIIGGIAGGLSAASQIKREDMLLRKEYHDTSQTSI
jgi:hypothetical protein